MVTVRESMSCKQAWTSLSADHCKTVNDHFNGSFEDTCPRHELTYHSNLCSIPMTIYESLVDNLAYATDQIQSCQSGNLRSYWIVVICVGIIGPILVTSFGYFLLFRQVKQVRRAVSAIGGGQRGLGGSIHKHDRSNSSEDDRLKLTLTLFCCSLAACWGPLIVINILRVIQVTYSLFWSI